MKLRLEFERKINTLNNYNRKLVQEKESYSATQHNLQKNFADLQKLSVKFETQNLVLRRQVEKLKVQEGEASLKLEQLTYQNEETCQQLREVKTENAHKDTILRQKMANVFQTQARLHRQEDQIV